MSQIEIHNRMDALLATGPEQADLAVLTNLVNTNDDAKTYFFTAATADWLTWLWQNGLLDSIKNKAEDPTRYSYRMPELRYLVRMTELSPVDVTNILHEVPVNSDTFNPEVVDQFLQIGELLPASELVRKVSGRSLIEKISAENWVKLMNNFNRWGYDYQKMFEILETAGKFSALVTLAEVVLSTRSSDEIKKTDYGSIESSLFYFSDLSHTGVLEFLVKVDSENAEAALMLLVNKFNEVTSLTATQGEETLFTLKDGLHLFDTDFFTLEMNPEHRMSYREDMREFMAALKILSKRVVTGNCADLDTTRVIYERTIGILADTTTAFKFHLYLWSRCPVVFTNELKDAFNKLFACTDSYYDVLGGAEYLKALKVSFEIVFTESEKREYIQKVIAYFLAKAKQHPDQKWHIGYAGRIISMITDYVESVPELIETIKAEGIEYESDFEPTPSISQSRGGTIIDRGPISDTDFAALSITEISTKLRTDWIPSELQKQNTNDDFLNPLNAEGAGNLIKDDVKNRFSEYIANSAQFFEPDALDLHYTYSFLRGIEEAFRNSQTNLTNINWTSLLTLFKTIETYCTGRELERKRRERNSFDAWLAGWDSIHSVIGDIMQALLRERNNTHVIDFATNRTALFDVTKYLLRYPDPEPVGEELGTATMKANGPDDNEMLVGDPFSIAINSVRGRAFQVFVTFVYLDSESFTKDIPVRLSADVQETYITVLSKERTRALMFMFGHYLPTFYFRAPTWTLERLPTIFPEDKDKYPLYLAAWEGFISTNLFEELFFEGAMQSLYHRGLHVEKEITRRYHRDPETGIATHIGLATIAYHERFTFEHPLFVAFWKEGTVKQKSEFASDIGRLFITSDNDRLSEKTNQAKQVLRNLWDWILANCEDSEVFAEFGFWIETKKDIFEHAWLANRVRLTLEKSGGELEWDYGLTQSIEALTAAAPTEVVIIARYYLLEGSVRKGHFMRPIRYDLAWFQVFNMLYKHPATKDATVELINELIEEGGSDYWELKKVII